MTAPDPRLGEIAARLAAATPGPWRWDENYGDKGDTGLALTNDAGTEIVGAYNHHCCSFRNDPIVEDNDAEFIAAAPADVAYLLAELRARDEALGRVEAVADEFAQEALASLNVEREIRKWPPSTLGLVDATSHAQHATIANNHAKRIRAAVAAATGGGDQ